MKKLLIVHNFYKDFGGEDSNIHEELEYFKKDYEVDFFYEKNKSFLNIFDILSFFIRSNIMTNRKFKETLDKFKPDVVYIHNTWFKANLGIFKILDKLQVPIVLKIHNFRYYCTQYFSSKKHLDSDSRCPMCNYSKSFLVFNKYFQESLLKSLFSII